jgi:hypothetical protein
MERRFWREYDMVPGGVGPHTDDFMYSMKFLEVLDSLGLIEVRPNFSATAHDWVQINIDDIYYYEDIWLWIDRFN